MAVATLSFLLFSHFYKQCPEEECFSHLSQQIHSTIWMGKKKKKKKGPRNT